MVFILHLWTKPTYIYESTFLTSHTCFDRVYGVLVGSESFESCCFKRGITVGLSRLGNDVGRGGAACVSPSCQACTAVGNELTMWNASVVSAVIKMNNANPRRWRMIPSEGISSAVIYLYRVVRRAAAQRWEVNRRPVKSLSCGSKTNALMLGFRVYLPARRPGYRTGQD